VGLGVSVGAGVSIAAVVAAGGAFVDVAWTAAATGMALVGAGDAGWAGWQALENTSVSIRLTTSDTVLLSFISSFVRAARYVRPGIGFGIVNPGLIEELSGLPAKQDHPVSQGVISHSV
jgi:hypothetical protein